MLLKRANGSDTHIYTYTYRRKACCPHNPSCAGDWNGAGGHVNFSNNDTRAKETGWDAIKKQIAKLEKRHAVHIAAYGEGNERRLTGMLH